MSVASARVSSMRSHTRSSIEPTVRAMRARGTPFKGVLYAGLMIKHGTAKLIEYNVRFGDPEAQVLMPRLKSDLAAALLAACDGVLKDFALRWSDEAALTVVLAAEGYPGAVRTGSEIRGLSFVSRPDWKTSLALPPSEPR